MLPIAIQFSHAFEKHEFSGFSFENKIHNDIQDTDCASFHFKIFGPAVTLSSNILYSEIVIEKEPYSSEDQISSRVLQFKSTRDPPYLLL